MQNVFFVLRSIVLCIVFLSSNALYSSEKKEKEEVVQKLHVNIVEGFSHDLGPSYTAVMQIPIELFKTEEKFDYVELSFKGDKNLRVDCHDHTPWLWKPDPKQKNVFQGLVSTSTFGGGSSIFISKESYPDVLNNVKDKKFVELYFSVRQDVKGPVPQDFVGQFVIRHERKSKVIAEYKVQRKTNEVLEKDFKLSIDSVKEADSKGWYRYDIKGKIPKAIGDKVAQRKFMIQVATHHLEKDGKIYFAKDSKSLDFGKKEMLLYSIPKEDEKRSNTDVARFHQGEWFDQRYLHIEFEVSSKDEFEFTFPFWVKGIGTHRNLSVKLLEEAQIYTRLIGAYGVLKGAQYYSEKK